MCSIWVMNLLLSDVNKSVVQWGSNMLMWHRLNIYGWSECETKKNKPTEQSKAAWVITQAKFHWKLYREIQRHNIWGEQPQWAFLSSDDNTLPPLLCNLSSSSCSSERNKKKNVFIDLAETQLKLSAVLYLTFHLQLCTAKRLFGG